MEATLIMPFVFSFFFFFYRIILIILIHSRINTEVYEIGNKLVTYSAITEAGESALFDDGDPGILNKAGVILLAETTVRENLSESGLDKYIEDLSFLLSEYDAETGEIEITAVYRISSVLDDFSKRGIRLTNRFYGRMFIGFTRDPGESVYVYICEDSPVYHTDPECRAIHVEIKPVSESGIGRERNRSGAKYYECRVCAGATGEGVYYITEYGNRYHKTSECSELKRNVARVLLEEVKERRLCYYCGK